MIKRRDVFIAIVFFLLGSVPLYFYTLQWILSTRQEINTLIYHSGKIYDLQKKITANYLDSYSIISDCIEEKQLCDFDATSKEVDQLITQRQQLELELDNENNIIEPLVKQFQKEN